MDFLSDLFVVPGIEKEIIEVSFTAPGNCESGAWKILDENLKVIAEDQLSGSADQVITFTVSIPDCRLWSIDNPYLYTLLIDWNGNSEKTTFGMRSFGTCGRDLLLNGQKFCARGHIRGREAHDHPNLMGLSLTEYYEKNIKAAKQFGFNLIRFHSRIPHEECFEVADRLGMLIHIEIRKYYGKYQKERAHMSDEGEIINEKEWCAAVKSLRNHPSLMVYCMGNEIRNPGTNPFVEHIAKITKELDPTRLFIDTCAHGEFDRTYVDFDVQHMSYYYPFGQNYDMFDNTYNWLIYGSCKGQELVHTDDVDSPTCKITRAINSKRPVLAHEICHYAAYRNLDELSDKFDKYAPDQRPWWIDELKKLSKLKGYDKFYEKAREASQRFQFIGWKLGIEAARRSPLLTGFHFLQLADTERYENSNGLLDCFDDCNGVNADDFLKFNADTVLLCELPERTYFENGKINIPVLISHYAENLPEIADFIFEVKNVKDGKIIRSGKLCGIQLIERGMREICTVDILMPEVAESAEYKFTAKLIVGDNVIVENDWPIWGFPNRPGELPSQDAIISLPDIDTTQRYPQLNNSAVSDLMITNRFNESVFEQLDAGKDVLMLYRVDETRDRVWSCEYEKYYLPTVWDRLKGVIWDRGHNCGAIIEDHPAFAAFPHDGFVNLQFYGLIDDCDKINLDDFPVKVDPVMRGIDRASRDRFDVYTYQLPELQPEWTMRNFAYAFELKAGKGRLFVSAFNLSGLNRHKPAACAMFESLLRYVNSDKFAPQAEISLDALKSYLESKGASPRLRERRMTQYWQLNAEPLESARYWKESELYIAGKLKLPGK
jgi:beta-galactosidase